MQYGCLAAILELTLLKINRLLHIYISIVPLKFGVDIQSQTQVRVWKPKNPIWSPGSHFESDVAKINWLLPMTTINMHMEFEIEIRKQTWFTLRNSCQLHVQSLETEKSNMTARRPFWKWRCWKSIGSYPYTWVLCRWSLKLIFKAKVKLESGNQIIQYGRQAAIWKWRCWKSIGFCLWPPSTCIWNLKLKLQSKLDLCSGNHVVYRQTDGRTR